MFAHMDAVVARGRPPPPYQLAKPPSSCGDVAFEVPWFVLAGFQNTVAYRLRLHDRFIACKGHAVGLIVSRARRFRR